MDIIFTDPAQSNTLFKIKYEKEGIKKENSEKKKTDSLEDNALENLPEVARIKIEIWENHNSEINYFVDLQSRSGGKFSFWSKADGPDLKKGNSIIEKSKKNI